MNTKVVHQKGKAEIIQNHKDSKKQELKSKRFFYASMIVLSVIFAGLIVSLVWLLSNGTVLEIKNTPVPVRPTTIDHDQYILLHYDYCKYSNAEGIVTSSLVSKTSVLVLPEATDTTKKSCKSFDAPYPIPGQTPPETYHYEFKACYPLNPVKTVCNEWKSQEFTVEGSEPKKQIKVTYKHNL